MRTFVAGIDERAELVCSSNRGETAQLSSMAANTSARIRNVIFIELPY
jgi:hypothetical protein